MHPLRRLLYHHQSMDRLSYIMARELPKGAIRRNRVSRHILKHPNVKLPIVLLFNWYKPTTSEPQSTCMHSVAAQGTMTLMHGESLMLAVIPLPLILSISVYITVSWTE
jgi:hypothetical protein